MCVWESPFPIKRYHTTLFIFISNVWVCSFDINCKSDSKINLHNYCKWYHNLLCHRRNYITIKKVECKERNRKRITIEYFMSFFFRFVSKYYHTILNSRNQLQMFPWQSKILSIEIIQHRFCFVFELCFQGENRRDKIMNCHETSKRYRLAIDIT